MYLNTNYVKHTLCLCMVIGYTKVKLLIHKKIKCAFCFSYSEQLSSLFLSLSSFCSSVTTQSILSFRAICVFRAFLFSRTVSYFSLDFLCFLLHLYSYSPILKLFTVPILYNYCRLFSITNFPIGYSCVFVSHFLSSPGLYSSLLLTILS